jgi:DNA polymerase I-like protein with 3'-5' exonuclease and polymerase domains
MARFDAAAFCVAIQKELADLRRIANAKVADAIANSLGSEMKLVACVRDSTLIEVPAGSSATVGAELIGAACTALHDSFSSLRFQIGYGVGQSWADCAGDLERRLIQLLPNARKKLPKEARTG